MDQGTGYRIPVNFTGFFEKKRFERCSLQESIARHLHLLIITTHTEVDFDAKFGCDIWEAEFEAQQTTPHFGARMARSLKEVLTHYESRLKDIQVSASVKQAEFINEQGHGAAKRMKKQIHLDLQARLTATNEPFSFSDTILLSPFSTD